MDLIERLNDAWRKLYGDGDEHDVCDTIAEAAAALEAARADAERMKRDIAELYEAMPMLPITLETMDAATDWFERYCIEFYREISAALDAAIDQARGKGGGEVEGG